MNPLFSWYGKQLINPKTRWWVLLGTLLYLLSPVDVSPDFIPVLGQADDVVLLMMLVSGLFQWINHHAGLDNEDESSTMEDAAPTGSSQATIDVDAVEVQ